VIAAWLSAFAAPGQVRAAVYEDAPLFASQTEPAIGPSIRQTTWPPPTVTRNTGYLLMVDQMTRAQDPC
jgi:hypothetical protein